MPVCWPFWLRERFKHPVRCALGQPDLLAFLCGPQSAVSLSSGAAGPQQPPMLCVRQAVGRDPDLGGEALLVGVGATPPSLRKRGLGSYPVLGLPPQNGVLLDTNLHRLFSLSCSTASKAGPVCRVVVKTQEVCAGGKTRRAGARDGSGSGMEVGSTLGPPSLSFIHSGNDTHTHKKTTAICC